MLGGGEPRLLDPKVLPEVLGHALSPGMRVVSLINRSGLQLGIAGDAHAASVIAAIASCIWQSHEKVDGLGALDCLLIECEHGRLAIKSVGTFILSCCADCSVPFGLLRAKIDELHGLLHSSLCQIGS